MHTHRRLFGHAARVPAYMMGSGGLSVLLALVIMVQMYSLSLIIAGVFSKPEWPEPALLFLLAASILVRSLLVWLRERHARRHAVAIKSGIRREAFRQVVQLGPLHARSEKTGGLIGLLMEGTEKLEDYFTHYIPSLLHICILPPLIVLFVFWLDWPSGLILLITGPIIVFFMWLVGTYAKKISQEQWQSLGRLSAGFLDAVQGLKTLKLFGESERESERIAASSDGFRRMTMRVLRIAFLSGMVLELAASISIAMVAVQVGIRLIEGLMDFQPGLFMLLLAPEFYLPFRALGQHHHAGMEGSAAATDLFSLMDRPHHSHAGGQLPTWGPQGPEISCHQLSFTYPGQAAAAINNLSCRLPAGSLTAIVGPTGSGKTTFVHLLMAYMQPTQGGILLDQQPLQAMDAEQWRAQVAYVSQHPHFFDGSVLDNLLMAKPGASMPEVEEAARQAGADAFIRQMPQGYHTPLKNNASRLSGGERQRLAMARALLRQAPLLILDEPTSSLDPESEQLLSEALLRSRGPCTAIVIAHRLNTVRQADRILVFSRGQLAESGKHQELIKKQGIYYGFLSSQGWMTQNPDR